MRSGFTIVRNGVQFDYPFREAILSIAPFVDEIVVAHGDSTDSTLPALEALRAQLQLPCELRIVDSPWDPTLRQGGFELARQTNVALDHCRHDVCLYIQGDELLHGDEDAEILRRDLARLEQTPEAEGLSFAWVHFYGNYSTEVRSRRWYRREVRAVKKSAGLRSYADAQGFRIPLEGGGWRKPRVLKSEARVLHYGWVRPPSVMAAKTEAFEKLWGGEKQVNPASVLPPLFGMRPWSGKHPSLMHERIARAGHFDPFAQGSPEKNGEYWKSLTTSWIESLTGWRPGEFRNYELL